MAVTINADLGEDGLYDDQLMPYISSCNIACGGHFGTLDTITHTILLAQNYHVKVGAHPSFPDTVNFGRKALSLSNDALISSIVSQLQLFAKACNITKASFDHIKLHGALYNLSVENEAIASAVITAIKTLQISPTIYTIANGALHQLAKDKFPVLLEAFIDRNYTDNGRLVSRGESHALISSPEAAWQHFYSMAKDGVLITENKKKIPCKATTFCIHSDTENAVTIIKYIVKKAQENNLVIV